MRPNIAIRSIEITPNPVGTNEVFAISARIADRIPVIGEESYALADGDGTLVLTQKRNIACISTGAENEFISDAGGALIETEE